MSQRELLIVLAHAQWCAACRQRLIAAPEAVLRGRSLTPDERETIGHLQEEDFATPEVLARASGTSQAHLDEYAHHPVARLRHL